MTERELRRLGRSDLLELLLAQSREIEDLTQKLEEARAQLESRTITIEESGSIAEAALQLSGIFEAAQNACAQYTQNIQARYEQQEQTCARMERETRAKCDFMVAEARKMADEYWNTTRKKVQELYGSCAGLTKSVDNGA